MTEDQLQFKIVTWFHNSIPEERGYLYRTENKTTKGARDKGLGLIKGVSDLHYTAPCSMRCYFELKVMSSRHEVTHLEEQLHFIELQEKRCGLGFFVFELEHFQTIMANIVPNGVNLLAHRMAKDSVNYIRDSVNYARESRCKTVMLNYDFKSMVV